jgi:hypothetical protein
MTDDRPKRRWVRRTPPAPWSNAERVGPGEMAEWRRWLHVRGEAPAPSGDQVSLASLVYFAPARPTVSPVTTAPAVWVPDRPCLYRETYYKHPTGETSELRTYRRDLRESVVDRIEVDASASNPDEWTGEVRLGAISQALATMTELAELERAAIELSRAVEPPAVQTAPWTGEVRIWHGNSKLGAEEIAEIAELRRGGWSTGALARRFRVRRSTICYVLTGETHQGAGKAQPLPCPTGPEARPRRDP